MALVPEIGYSEFRLGGYLTENLAEDAESIPVSCKPFVKWVGGKHQLLPELLARVERLPKMFDRYFEPFVGGGALFFALQPARAFLSDSNSELINLYLVVREQVGALIADLKQHVYEEKYYYKMRDIDRTPEYSRLTDVQRASRFIFLNKTCFNGLYRVNSRGEFNVPFGRYVNPKICDSANLRACGKVLLGSSVTEAPFDVALKEARRGDFVYFDPPYAPLNTTSNFTSYTRAGFGPDMQIRLADVCQSLDAKGVKFMLSNSSAPEILSLYKNFNLEFVKAARAVNSKAEKRGKIDEVIVTNY